MAKDLTDWISRQAQISGDARQDLVRVARRKKWEMQSFAEIICGEPASNRDVADVCSPFEIAVLTRAWRMDFGVPSPRKGPRRHHLRENLEERQHYIGGHTHMYMLDDYVAADDEFQDREVKVIPRVKEAWPDTNRYHREDPRPVEPVAEVQETLDQPRRMAASADLVEATALCCFAGAIFVCGSFGLKKFELPELQLTGYAPYAGNDPAGLADLAAGPDFIVCVDLEGCVFRYDAQTCELQATRAYQPSVVEHSQRIVASQLEKLTSPILGLEGGLGGASRLAANSRSIFLGGRDGVVTSYAASSLSLTGRCRLQEGSMPIGIRALFLSSYQRLYCAVLSSVHVLAVAGMYELARLRGGPRVPVFGSVSAVAESLAGDLAFVADVGGPSIHLWSTKSWQWSSRVELPQGAGPARQLAVLKQVLYASTASGRLMAYDFSRDPVLCVREGPGGGPMSAGEVLAVLWEGALRLQS